MLIPRFSLLNLIVITTLSAVVCYVIAMATRGHQWALAVSIAIGSVALALLVHAMIFSFAWVLTLIGRPFTKQVEVASPFADAVPPPQIVTPPEDTE